jgi:hypothetical protein
VDCPYCTLPAARIWIESEHAIAFAADAPAVDGHTLVIPKEHVPTIHALPMAVQKGVWTMVSQVRGKSLTVLSTGRLQHRVRGWDDGGGAGATHCDPCRPSPGGRERGATEVRRAGR